MALQDIERVINTVADSMSHKDRPLNQSTGTIRLQYADGEREFKRPAIIRSTRVNGLTLSRDEIKAFARLKARSREFARRGKAGAAHAQ